MEPQEAVMLTRYVRALCPQQRFDEYTPDAWHDVLGGYRLEDARQAAAQLASRQAFIAPGELVPEIRRIRAERIGSQQPAYEPPPGDETVPQYLARRRAQLRAIGDGRERPITVGALPPGDRRQREAAAAATMRAIRQQIRETKQAAAAADDPQERTA
jgi:hypothetical protein